MAYSDKTNIIIIIIQAANHFSFVAYAKTAEKKQEMINAMAKYVSIALIDG